MSAWRKQLPYWPQPSLSSLFIDLGLLLINSFLPDPYVDVALVGGHKARLREPRFVELNNEIPDDVGS